MGKRAREGKVAVVSNSSSISAALQNLVCETIEAASTLSSSELAARIEQFSQEGLRSPVRDLASYLGSSLSADVPSPRDLVALTRCVSASGRVQVYDQRLFDILLANRKQLSVSDLCMAVYECGRHGLRSKHFLASFTAEISDRIHSKAAVMSAQDAWRLWTGVVKFPREHQALLLKTVHILERGIGNLNLRELSVLARISKELHFLREFANFQVVVAAAAGRLVELGTGSPAAKLSEMTLLLAASEQQEKTNPKVFDHLIAKSIDLLKCVDDFSEVDTVGLVDILHTLRTWKRKFVSVAEEEGMWRRMNDELVKRRTEIKYSPNCGLWHVAAVAVDALVFSGDQQEFVFEEFLLMVQGFCRDPFMLERVSVWQITDVLCVLSGRRLYDKLAYDAMIDFIYKNIDEFKDSRKFAAMLNAISHAGHKLDDKMFATMCRKIAVMNIPSAEVAGDLLWGLAVQKNLGGEVVEEVEKNLLEMFLKSSKIRSSKRRRILQVRRAYKDLVDEGEDEIIKQIKFVEIMVDNKGKDVRTVRHTTELGANILKM
jgi:hypothetical protein